MGAFGAWVSLLGAAKDVVDFNVYSPDGNPRQKLGPDGVDKGPDTKFTQVHAAPGSRPYYTDPDGKVDMRDFRRFRDAWLQTCADAPSLARNVDSCPALDAIMLNGADDHPKKDLNFDGCVYLPLASDPNKCGTTELDYSRFDFNGDGKVSRSATAPMPLLLDGTPSAASRTPMTDLDVLKSQWGLNTGELPGDPRTADTEGWNPSDLDKLMESGDLEIHAADFFTGPEVTDVDISVRRLDTADILPPRKITPQPGDTPEDRFIVITAPVQPFTTKLEVRASALVGGTKFESQPQTVTLGLAEDKRLDFCETHLTLQSNR